MPASIIESPLISSRNTGSLPTRSTGNGKTSVKAVWSYFYDTRITLANNLGGLFTQTILTWGPNQSSGACSTAANSGCWTDANRDGQIQASELIGTRLALEIVGTFLSTPFAGGRHERRVDKIRALDTAPRPGTAGSPR